MSGHYSFDRDHPVRPFLLAAVVGTPEPWASVVRDLVAEHDVTSVYGFRLPRRVAGRHADERYDWDAPNGDCDTACGACSDTSGRDEHNPMPHPCPTLLRLALVYRDRPGFDPSWLPPDVVAGEIAPPGIAR